jgi:hypothetical protein
VPIASMPLSTLVEEFTTNVVLYPSGLFAVIEVELTAVTVPDCRRLVTYPPLPSEATKSPCRALLSPLPDPPPNPPGPPPGPPAPPGPNWPLPGPLPFVVVDEPGSHSLSWVSVPG